jgi:serine/threonine protein kinase
VLSAEQNIRRVKLNIIYTKEDKDFFERLEKHLAVLKHLHLIDQLWHSDLVELGENIQDVITGKISDSDIVILLISADFIASDFYYKDQLDLILKLHKEKALLVVPVLTRYCPWQFTKISWMNMLPDKELPLSSPQWETPDKPYSAIAESLISIIHTYNSPQPKAPEAPPMSIENAPTVLINPDNRTIAYPTVFGQVPEYIKSNIVGQVVQGYRIERYIASGGFGAVYEAAHSVTGHRVALKISHGINYFSDEFRKMLVEGNTIIPQLQHPNIVHTYHISSEQIEGSQRLVIAMDYIQGSRIDEFSKYKLTADNVQQLIDIYKKIVDAIDFAHRLEFYNADGQLVQGVVHGDIKPSNIILTSTYEPILLDFLYFDVSYLKGFQLEAQFDKKTMLSPRTMYAPPPPTDPNATIVYPSPPAPGQTMYVYQTIIKQNIFGTRGYMAPEQAEQGIVNKQTDIYQLGILLFEMLHPHRFSTYTGFSSPRDIYQTLSKYTPGIPAGLSDIIFRATQPQAWARYGSVEEIMSDVLIC